jgi:hypothetical protein
MGMTVKAIIDCLYVSLRIAGFVVGLCFYVAVARYFFERITERVRLGSPLSKQSDHALE